MIFNLSPEPKKNLEWDDFICDKLLGRYVNCDFTYHFNAWTSFGGYIRKKYLSGLLEYRWPKNLFNLIALSVHVKFDKNVGNRLFT